MSDPTSVPGALWAWLRERFPPGPAALYAAAIFYAAWAGAGAVPDAPAPRWAGSAAGALILVLALLHVRIFDEHKDFEDDRVAHPERLLSRGIVTLRQLRGLLVPVLALEAALSAALGTAVFWAWLLLLGFTLAMRVDFGCRPFLARHPAANLALHQLIVLPMVLLAAAERAGGRMPAPAWLPRLGLCALAVMGATVTWEIARKTWSPGREHARADSYSCAWGRGRAAAAALATAGLGCGAWAGLLRWGGASTWALLPALLALALLAIAELRFLRDPTAGRSKRVELAGALFALLSLIGGAAGILVS